MCGVVGYMGVTSKTADDAFTDLLYMDVVRGKNGTGVAAVSAVNNVFVEKVAGFPWDLEASGQLERVLKGVNRILIGHNRAATKGTITAKNTHPFVHGNIVGVHNGTLISEKGLANPYKFGTDSEALINSIEEIGIDETYANMDGAATLIYYDAEEETLNMITNGQRPLFFAHVKGGKGFFWASERWMLAGIESRYKSIEYESVKYPNPHNLFSFHWDNKVEVEWRKLVPFERPVHRGNYGGYMGYEDQWLYGNYPRYQKKQEEEKKEEQKEEVKDNIVDFVPDKDPITPRFTSPQEQKSVLQNNKEEIDVPIKIENNTISRKVGDFGNIWVTREEFESRMKNCCFCGESIDFNDLDVDIFDEYSAACGDCHSVYNMQGINPHFAKN